MAEIIDLTIEKEHKCEVEKETCVICLDKTANTIVLPCMHIVACKECSKKLEYMRSL